MKKIKSLCALTAIAAALFAPVAKADYVLAFQGVTFTIGVLDPDSLSLRIQNAASTTNADWASATNFGAFSLKDLGLDFSAAGGATAIATYFTSPSNITVNGVRDDLNASAINGGADCVAQTKGETGTVCFDFAPDLLLLDDLLFQIDFNQAFTIGSAGPHLKVAFVDANGGKIGSLLSQNLPLSSSSSTSSGEASSSGVIPEPGTSALALLGLALVAGSFAMRRKAAVHA